MIVARGVLTQTVRVSGNRDQGMPETLPYRWGYAKPWAIKVLAESQNWVTIEGARATTD